MTAAQAPGTAFEACAGPMPTLVEEEHAHRETSNSSVRPEASSGPFRPVSEWDLTATRVSLEWRGPACSIAIEKF
jgi:hypothetical protein